MELEKAWAARRDGGEQETARDETRPDTSMELEKAWAARRDGGEQETARDETRPDSGAEDGGAGAEVHAEEEAEAGKPGA
jgi:hypothetical protein